MAEPARARKKKPEPGVESVAVTFGPAFKVKDGDIYRQTDALPYDLTVRAVTPGNAGAFVAAPPSGLAPRGRAEVLRPPRCPAREAGLLRSGLGD